MGRNGLKQWFPFFDASCRSPNAIRMSISNVGPTSFNIGNSLTRVMEIVFSAKEDTNATFLAEVLFETQNEKVVETVEGTITEGTTAKDVTFTRLLTGNSELTVTYKMNDNVLETFCPKKTCLEGKHILTLFLPITQVIQNARNTLSVSFSINGGKATIGEGQMRATITGQGLVASMEEWDGNLSLSDNFVEIAFEETEYKVDRINENIDIEFGMDLTRSVTDSFRQLVFKENDFGCSLLSEIIEIDTEDT